MNLLLNKFFVATFLWMALILFPGSSRGIVINAVFDAGLTAADRAIINDAILEWTRLFKFSRHTLTIEFVINNTLTELGSTGGWDFTNGLPTSPTVTINYNAHNWTLGAPAANRDDALDTLKHEVGHALGFTVIGANFAAHVLTLGGNRFFDLDQDGMFNALNDFDLIDDPLAGTHAPAGSGDLMQPSTPQGQRNHPTMRHARVLALAYGYSVPEPSAILLVGTGLVIVFAFGRRKRESLG